MSLQWFNSPADLLAAGEAQPTMTVMPIYTGPFPFVEDMVLPDCTPGPRENVQLAAVLINKVVVGGGSDEYVSVALCRLNDINEPEWSIYCGDGQIQGTFKTDGKKLAMKLRAEGKVSNKLANMLESSEWNAKVPAMTQCNFFKMLKRSGKFCQHTKAALSQIQAQDLEDLATDLKGWHEGKEATASSTGTSAMGGSVEEARFRDAAFIQNAFLVGERGSGKTTLARSAADDHDAVYLELQMHQSMEAWELRAHDRAWNGKVFTVLGKLAEAVHWVQKGKRVVLCLDEFLNRNQMYTTAINSCLSLTQNDTYMVETGRIVDQGDGIGTIEVVEVPADMLWVVATSNVGANYNIDKINPAVRARFLIILLNNDPNRIEAIVESVLMKYSMPLDLADKFKSFIERVNQAVRENTLDEEASTRLAVNVIRTCAIKAKRDGKTYPTMAAWLPRIREQLMAEMTQIVNFETGSFDAEQEAIYDVIVKESF